MIRDRDARDLLAATYVLGTLRGPARRRFERELERDPALRRAVAAWERRLGPLEREVPDLAPPARVWTRIEAAVAPARPAGTPLWQRLGFWRWLAGGLAAATVALLVVVLQPPRPAGPVVAVVQDQGKEPVWTLRLDASERRLVVETLRPQSPGPDRSLQLWVLQPGATAPAPGPLLPARGRAEASLSAELAALLAGAGQVLVSVEPPGGAPAGVPTGPVLYAGTLRGI
jgi:anti-sigma-K factor RskA